MILLLFFFGPVTSYYGQPDPRRTFLVDAEVRVFKVV